MKLSAILVSVNLVALPVAAQAAEEAVSDKGEWLKLRLAAIGQAGKPEPSKVSMLDPGISPKMAKIRNFMPNRHLPRRSEVAALVAQKPRLDPTVPAVEFQALTPRLDGPLTGQVSTYARQPQPAGSKPAIRSYPRGVGFQRQPAIPVKPAAAAVPGQVPTLPGQVLALGSNPALPVIPMPAGDYRPAALNYSNVLPSPPPSRETRAGDGETAVNEAEALLVQPPVLTAEQQSLVDELVELNRPGRALEFQDLPGRHSSADAHSLALLTAQPRPEIGPPPFPLNLLPEDALKDFIRGSRRQAGAPPQSFGSWHRQSTNSHWPPAGFHSYLAERRFPGRYYGNARAVAVRQALTGRSAPAHKLAKVSFRPHVLAHNQISQVRMLVYPPYQGLRVSAF